MVGRKPICAELLKLGRALQSALTEDPRATGVRLMKLAAKRVWQTDTAGYSLTIAKLPGNLPFDLWIDHYTAHPIPRVWFGFCSSSRSAINRVQELSRSAGYRRAPIVKSSRDVNPRKPYRFISRLRADQFDRLIRENYRQNPSYYLGIYSPYACPIASTARRALVREMTNFVCGFSSERQPQAKRRSMTRIGPWARPDPLCERAAVRHVRAFLRQDGYTVKSHESEICGYDLHATRNGRELHVEVKGCSGAQPRFFLTRNELTAARTDRAWRLAIVTSALRSPRRLPLISSKGMSEAFTLEPTQWEGQPR